MDSTDLPIDKEHEHLKEPASAAATQDSDTPQNPPKTSVEPEKTTPDPIHKETSTAPANAQGQPQPMVLPTYPRTEAKHAFNAFNFLGLHWVGNSSLSLWITYNIVNRPGVQQFMHTLSKGITPIVEGYDKLKGAIGLSKLQNVSKEIRANQINQSARSMTEVACMCIAGSIILFPVKMLEDHHGQLTRWFDELIHPAHKRERLKLEAEAKEKGLPKPVEPHDPNHRPETWTNLIRARALALVPIFWIDGQMEGWNNARAAKGLSNINTWEWELGTKAYQNMDAGWREKFVKFFSSKGIKLSKVQHLVRDHLLETVKAPEELKTIGREMTQIQNKMVLNSHDAALISASEARLAQLETQIVEKNLVKATERAIFAEQARLFSKEVSLTLIYTGFLFLLGKTNIVPWAMKKLGWSKKEEIGLTDAIETSVGNLDVLPFNNPDKIHGLSEPSNGQAQAGNNSHNKNKIPAAAAETTPKSSPQGFQKDTQNTTESPDVPKEGFASRFKKHPNKTPATAPSELYTKKISSDELTSESKTWDRFTV